MTHSRGPGTLIPGPRSWGPGTPNPSKTVILALFKTVKNRQNRKNRKKWYFLYMNSAQNQKKSKNFQKMKKILQNEKPSENTIYLFHFLPLQNIPKNTEPKKVHFFTRKLETKSLFVKHFSALLKKRENWKNEIHAKSLIDQNGQL